MLYRPKIIGKDKFILQTGLEPVTYRLEGGCNNPTLLLEHMPDSQAHNKYFVSVIPSQNLAK